MKQKGERKQIKKIERITLTISQVRDVAVRFKINLKGLTIIYFLPCMNL